MWRSSRQVKSLIIRSLPLIFQSKTKCWIVERRSKQVIMEIPRRTFCFLKFARGQIITIQRARKALKKHISKLEYVARLSYEIHITVLKSNLWNAYPSYELLGETNIKALGLVSMNLCWLISGTVSNYLPWIASVSSFYVPTMKLAPPSSL